MSWFLREVIRFEGSSRAVGLLRILVGAILWGEYADRLVPFRREGFDPISVVFFASSTSLFLGLLSRPSALVMGVLQIALVLFGPLEPWRHHHSWLLAVATFLLAFTPCDRSLSVDRWLAVRRAERRGLAPPAEWGPLWATRLLALQLFLLYALGAVDKLTPGFLAGERLEMIFAEVYDVFVPVAFPGWIWAMRVASWLTIAAEAFLAVAMWFRPLRLPALLLAMALHAAFYLSIPVGTFSVTTIALWLVVLDPGTVHAAFDRLLGVRTSPIGQQSGTAEP
jgi:hypothetical protein